MEKSATGEEIIEALLNNLEQSLEPLRYTVLAPSVFDVYLHPQDLERLSGILPQIMLEARQALEDRLDAMRKEAQPSGLRKLLSGKALGGKATVKEYKNVAGGWFLSFFENADPDVKPGDILIDSRLNLPKGPELEGGKSRTRRISTLRSEGASRVVGESMLEEDLARGGKPASSIASGAHPLPAAQAFSPHVTTERRPAPSSAEHPPLQVPAPARPSAETVKVEARAILRYTDNTGPQSFVITRPEITVGRGGTGHWVDVRLDTSADISRTHLKIRRDERGRFFIRDLSAYGTSVNGYRLPSSLEQQGDRKIDKVREEQLPEKARISLADMLFMDFEVRSS